MNSYKKAKIYRLKRKGKNIQLEERVKILIRIQNLNR